MKVKIPNFAEQQLPEELSKTEELSGKLSKQYQEDKLMNSVLEHDDNTIDDGKLMSDAINNGFSSFVPDMMFESLTKDFTMAKNLYGESIIRLVSGYEPNYIKKNLNIPEFQRELNQKLQDKLKDLQEKGLLGKEGDITEEGYYLSSLILYTEELDHLIPKGFFGEKINKKVQQYGQKGSFRDFKKDDSYRNIAIRRSIKKAIRRNHKTLAKEDLLVIERKSKGAINVIYAIDASGSMKGKKIEAAKKAGIALAYKAIEQKDPVGLVVFGTEIKEKVQPTLNFSELLMKIARIKAAKETNMTESIRATLEIFPRNNVTKHLIILTDAMPTIGKEPQKEALESVSLVRNSGITVSIVGIDMDQDGEKFARKISEAGGGNFYCINDLDNLDTIILEDYNRLK